VRPKLTLLLILLLYMSFGALYAIKTPDWQVPDEPAHYNYVRQLAKERRLPILERGDYDQDYLGRLTGEAFPPELSLQGVEYEDWQPPLYYLLATPVYLVFDGALTPLRLLSVLLGGGVVLSAYAVARLVFPQSPLIPLGTAAFVAFLPQHVAMMAGVNNDSLTELLIGLSLWMALRWLGAAPVRARGNLWLPRLGVLLGLGLVTKLSFLPVAVTVGLVLLLAWWRGADRSWRALSRRLVLVFGPALLIAAVWWLRNIMLYGGLDIYGTINHDAVVAGQPRTADWIADNGVGPWLRRWITFTFQSFWGQFGWMGVLMPTWLYRLLAVWSGVLLFGLFYALRSGVSQVVGSGTDEVRTNPASQLSILGIYLALVVLVYGYYNVTFVQHQGRYLFPGLIPIAMGAAISVAGWLHLLRVPGRTRPLAFALPYLAMAALNLYALWRVILPALA
jgi:4-amino-4-deoxy-L-arabinose transferase-like glycosyltransferase